MRNIEKIKIGENGEQLPADATNHVAVLLPAFGLMFTATVIALGEARQEKLEQACKAVTVAGFSDWDMPEIEELELLVDRTRHAPAFDTNFFRDIPNDWLWSKTPAAWSSASAWSVYAGGGLVYLSLRSSYGFALAVRRVGQ